MNKWIAMGRFTDEPEVRRTNSTTIASFRLAVDRRFKRDGQPEADFFRCVSFGKQAEFIENYMHRGTKVIVEAEVQNDNYEKDGVKHYGTSMVINSIEFAESKKVAEKKDDFMSVPDEEEVPF